MVALYVVFGLIAVGLGTYQIVAIRRRSAGPSIDRYHRAINVLSELPDHVRVVDGHTPTGKGLADNESAATPHEPPPRVAVIGTAQSRVVRPLFSPSEDLLGSTTPIESGPIGSGPNGRDRPPDPRNEPTPTTSVRSLWAGLGTRRRAYALALGAVVVVAGTLAGVLATGSSGPLKHLANAKAHHHHRAPQAPAVVSVPNVIGLRTAAAEGELSEAGLTWHVVMVTAPDAAAGGTVRRENPAPSAIVDQSGTVTLDVARPYLTTKVPAVANPGETVEAAESALRRAGFRSKVNYVKATTASQLAMNGGVLSESPAGGSTTAQHSVVTINVVRGAAVATVPTSIVGETPAEAGAALANAHLEVGTTTATFSRTVHAGDIVSSSPEAPGQPTTVGSTVNLVISIGPAAVVPNLRGDSVAKARRALRSAGLLLGQVRSAAGRAGVVIAQAAKPGRQLHQRTPIAIVVGSTPAGTSGVGSAVPPSTPAANSGP